jgi:hypothetical protein
MCVGSSLWVLLAMAGISAVPRGWHPVHECACLLSLLLLWGQRYGVNVAAAVFLQATSASTGA